MPVAPTYPGVYIEEIPSGVHTITGVATSITAFVGRALRGPVNKQTMVTSFADFERTFGGLWTLGSLSFAVSDFFANGGSQAIIVRVFNATEPAVVAPPAAADAGAQQAIAAVQAAAAPATAASVAAAARKALGASPPAAADAAVKLAEQAAQASGATPQSVVTALQNAADPTVAAALAAGATAAAAKNAAATDVAAAVRKAVGAKPTTLADGIAKAGETADAAAGATPQSVLDAVTTAAAAAGYPALSDALTAATQTAAPTPAGIAAAARARVTKNAPPSSAAEAVVSAGETAAAAPGATTATVIDAMNKATALPVAAAAVPAGQAPAAAPSAKASIALGALTLEAASEGTWGADLAVRVDSLSNIANLSQGQAQDIAAALGVGIGDLFTLTVHENGGSTEIWANVTVVDSARRLDKVLLTSALVRVSGALPAAPPSQSLGKLATTDPWTSATSTLATGGSDGGPLGPNDLIGDDLTKTGLYALKDADLFNILVIPPPVPGLDDVYTTVVPPAVTFCEQRRAVMIIDPPTTWTSIDAVTQAAEANPPIGGTASTYAAIYFPMLIKRNPLAKNQLQTFPASGSIAGIYARTDSTRGVWKAPAGLDATLTGAADLSLPMNDLENGELNQLGVNCLRVKAAVGPIVWGARTTAGDDRLTSDWKYVPVRRTALFLEESLFRGTQWVVFEPNDEPLWSQIRLNVGAFMQSLFVQGAFQGLTPKDAYFVKCDSESTTQNDIDNGIVNIIVGFAPLKPAEFVVIQIQQIAGNIQT